mmetsp:Transcript_24186/g.76680  ORF Transcript_24186/g.76680 Transcript_24186/m.76680 type:complete len:90 (-) Transcript_24186:541-810(-)
MKPKLSFQSMTTPSNLVSGGANGFGSGFFSGFRFLGLSGASLLLRLLPAFRGLLPRPALPPRRPLLEEWESACPQLDEKLSWGGGNGGQ